MENLVLLVIFSTFDETFFKYVKEIVFIIDRYRLPMILFILFIVREVSVMIVFILDDLLRILVLVVFFCFIVTFFI